MNCLAKALKFSFAALWLLLAACGVKGDPVPPDKPSEIGRGRPTYKRATEGIRIKRSTPSIEDEDDEKDEDDER